MPQPSNTYDSYDFTHDKEDFRDIVYTVTPTDTPFMSMIGTATAKNVFHEWTTDTLAAADDTNARDEGENKTASALTPPSRIGNYCQISDKVFSVSDTTKAIDVAGASDEYLRQKLKKGIELKRDMEKVLLKNQAWNAGSDGAPKRYLRGMEAFIATNVSRAGDGASGTASTGTAATDGTPRAFDPSQVTAVAELCYQNSSEWPSVMMVAPTRRKDISGLINSQSNRNIDFEAGKLVTSVRVYETDFGDLNVVTNRHMRTASIAFLSPDQWEVAYLQGRDFVSTDLAKTGDNTQHMLVSEYTLVCKNEAANGIIADLG